MRNPQPPHPPPPTHPHPVHPVHQTKNKTALAAAPPQILRHPRSGRHTLFFHLDTPDFEAPALGRAVSSDGIAGAAGMVRAQAVLWVACWLLLFPGSEVPECIDDTSFLGGHSWGRKPC